MDFLPILHELLSQLPGGGFVWTLFIFIFALSILVFVHEYGHYAAARSVGIHVDAFSIGFGRELFGWHDKNGTRWKFCLIPLGGYVQMFGEDASEVDEGRQREDAFSAKTPLQRMWVVIAGPLANFILAVLFLWGLYASGEQVPQDPDTQPAVVGAVQMGMPADIAGIQVGDVITAVNGTPVGSFPQLAELVAPLAGQEVQFTITRPNQLEPIVFTITPKPMKGVDGDGNSIEQGKIGIQALLQYETVQHSIGGAFIKAVDVTYDYSLLILKTVWHIMTGKTSSDNIGGPILIAETAANSAQQGTYWLVFFMAIISINLGLINLFPVPVLDGGRLIMYTIELVMGAPLSARAQGVADRIGMFLVGLLFIFVFYNDIMRILKTL